ncbi:TonB-dependent receptor [Panacibacter ginsenosidivorans]|uniref:TonB-dependent receptor n=1 Tax=Panacibacter ginsenosidivorans TaxID=1813871 RepID=A0A5B8V3R6_9BACT|nr:TonB-dependent receptor [Panacibacter ginsenosidivorans]QEC66070.1 TonB-dependent receptor [Panacibacter ginsenosidivorans]
MLKRSFLTFLLLNFLLCADAQGKFTLNGYVKDSLSGETLIGANISVKEEGRGASTNQYGFFSLTLAKGNYELLISYVGYQPKLITINFDENKTVNILMSQGLTDLNNVTVIGKKRESNVKSAQMGKVDLNISTIKALPAFLGEVDILKSLQLLPGVRNAGEGNSGFYVRGGGPDQNLILLDDAVVYNTGHLFGFFSVFNSDAIKSLSLIKGGMPPQYGGRLSSVIDIAMKDGNMNKTEVDAGIGLIASRLAIQGPLKKNKASYMISARRTYIDGFTKLFIGKNNSFNGSGYYFYDLNAKMNYIFSEKDRLYLSGYFGRDKFDFNNGKRSFKVSIPWGNSTATLRWNHIFSKKLFANTSLVYNDYRFSFNGQQNDFNIKLSSGIKDLNAKTDFDFFATPEHKLKFGAQYTFHTFLPSVVSGNQDTVEFKPANVQRKYANEYALYLQDDWDISRKIKVNYGIRYSSFQQVGKYTAYTTDANGNKLDSTTYKSGQTVKSYGGFEPRITMRYAINDYSSIKAGITRNLQYIHLVSNAGSTLPTDIWVPSTYRVKPQIGWQYAAGYFRNFSNNMFETSLELYYKTMQNQIEYREGYTPNTLKDPEEDFVFGKGWSYGSELFVNKVKGRLTGWVGYTISWTWRRFPQLNDGKKYPSKYDRRHDLSVVGTYELSSKWKLSSVFVFGTGNAISLPERFYFVDGTLTQEYSRINAYRMKPYHRLDFSAIYTPVQKKKRKYTGSWVFSIYNVYSRANPYFYYFDQQGSATQGTLTVTAKQVSLFPIIPAVTWNVKF